MGYGLRTPILFFLRNDRTCFWGGTLAIAYVMNRMGEGTLGDERGAGPVMATYAGLAA